MVNTTHLSGWKPAEVLHLLGVRYVIARSFARIFWRLPALSHDLYRSHFPTDVNPVHCPVLHATL